MDSIKSFTDADRLKTNRPTISLCMMVKNEERRLDDALASAKPWVDEIIVVDTGSTDRTVEIAESYGAKIFHHPWEHNFSKHRNQSIGYAEGDWLLILDADEELDQETAPLLRQLVYVPEGINCILFELYNDVQTGGQTFLMHPRMFRNHQGFHYEGKVHNRPVIPGGAMKSVVKIKHYGYNEDESVMSAKHDRRVEMIEKWVSEEPDNFHAYSYLAHTLQARSETWPRVVETALTGIELLRKSNTPDKAQFFPHLYYPLLNTLTSQGKDEELFQYAAECEEIAPYYPDTQFFVTLVRFKRQEWEQTREAARKFVRLQDECRDYPERFIFFENLTYNQINNVLFRWVTADAHLGYLEEAKELFLRMFNEAEGELICKMTVQHLLDGFPELAMVLAQSAQANNPAWPWPALLLNLAEEKNKETQADALKQDGLDALAQGRKEDAAVLLRQAIELRDDADAMLALAQTLQSEGLEEEAYRWMVKALNLHPGHDWAWKAIADKAFAAGDYAGAEACYSRYWAQTRDDSVQGRLTMARRRLEQGQALTVRQKPPKLVVFLMGGYTPEMLQQPAPHFLIGTAWGEFLPSLSTRIGDPAWVTLMTGRSPEEHECEFDTDFTYPVSLNQSKVMTLWELLPKEISVGFMAAPLAWPALDVPGWSVGGYPNGLLEPQKAYPQSLTPLLLASGFRSDYVMNSFDHQVLGTRLSDIRNEAFMFQVERAKINAALRLPAVDVLVLGFTALDYVQQTHGLAHYGTFSAYQQSYAWIDVTLSALQPQGFVILSQQRYQQNSYFPATGGFYCLSWLRGEKAQADPLAVAPEIMSFLGGDSSLLGQGRD